MKNLNMLETFRTKEELINYFDEIGQSITEEEIENLKKNYEQTEGITGNLSLQQLEDVAGGVEFSGHGLVQHFHNGTLKSLEFNPDHFKGFVSDPENWEASLKENGGKMTEICHNLETDEKIIYHPSSDTPYNIRDIVVPEFSLAGVDFFKIQKGNERHCFYQIGDEPTRSDMLREFKDFTVNPTTDKIADTSSRLNQLICELLQK